MAKVRVFQNSDSTVRVMHLNERHRLPGETDAQFFARETAKQPELAALPFADVDSTTLPGREGVDAQGDATPLRAAWRLVAGAVQANAADLPPNWPKVTERLKAVIPPVRRAVLADFIAALKQAIEDRDVAFFQALYDKLKAAQASATPPLTAAQFDAVKLTITEKKIPIVL